MPPTPCFVKAYHFFSLFDPIFESCYHEIMKLQEVREKITLVLKENPVEYIGVFGSVARGEAAAESDVDVLVKFVGRPTFAAYLKLDEGLRRQLGRKVDLVTVGAVNKFLRPQIERDLKMIYGKRPHLFARN